MAVEFTEIMPLSAAEKQRRYRARCDADPDKREAYIIKERLSWQQRRSSGKIKSISELSERTQRKVRKQWRDAQRKHRRKDEFLITPPTSPGFGAGQAPSTSR